MAEACLRLGPLCQRHGTRLHTATIKPPPMLWHVWQLDLQLAPLPAGAWPGHCMVGMLCCQNRNCRVLALGALLMGAQQVLAHQPTFILISCIWMRSYKALM